MTPYLPLSYDMHQLDDIFFHKKIPSLANGSSLQSPFLAELFQFGIFKTERVVINTQQNKCSNDAPQGTAQGDPKPEQPELSKAANSTISSTLLDMCSAADEYDNGERKAKPEKENR